VFAGKNQQNAYMVCLGGSFVPVSRIVLRTPHADWLIAAQNRKPLRARLYGAYCTDRILYLHRVHPAAALNHLFAYIFLLNI
jgi:hypothetical protein